ncbi:hypothetical protein ACLKA6_004809 [Drosophila palustris]
MNGLWLELKPDLGLSWVWNRRRSVTVGGRPTRGRRNATDKQWSKYGNELQPKTKAYSMGHQRWPHYPTIEPTNQPGASIVSHAMLRVCTTFDDPDCGCFHSIPCRFLSARGTATGGGAGGGGGGGAVPVPVVLATATAARVISNTM